MSALLQIHDWYTTATEKPLQTHQQGAQFLCRAP